MSEIRASQVFVKADLENILTGLLGARPDWWEPIAAMLTAIGAAPPQRMLAEHYIDAQLGAGTGDQAITVRRQIRTVGR